MRSGKFPWFQCIFQCYISSINTNTDKPTSWRGGKGGQGPRRQASGPKDRSSFQDRRDSRLQPQNKDVPPTKAQEKPTRGPNVVALPQENHIPVNSYNAQEVEEALKATPNAKSTFYRLAPSSAEMPKTQGPWASKRNDSTPVNLATLTLDTANTMYNGKDFFVELRKQVSAARQGGGSTPGG